MEADHPAISFEFIADEDFRASLERDYDELQTALGGNAAKAALVLSGSIVEAVLVDYLQSTGQKKPDPLRMDLADLITACAKAGVLSDRTAELSSVIRSYRNLIHPGRVARLSESFGTEDAEVAGHVVRIIVREVAKRRVEEFGLTADQLVSKFEHDHSAPAIVELLLRDLRVQDARRLLLEVLPARFFDHFDEDWDYETEEILRRLSVLYRAVFAAAPEETKKLAAKRYVEVLREETSTRVEAYDEYFFRASDVAYLTKAARELVAAHIVARLSPEARVLPPPALLESAVGLSEYLSEEQFEPYIDGFIRVAAYGQDAETRARGLSALQSEYFTIRSEERDATLGARLDTWIAFLREKGQGGPADELQTLRDRIILLQDIPF